MTDLLKDLEAVRGMLARADAEDEDGFKIDAAFDALDFLRTHHAEIAEAVADARFLRAISEGKSLSINKWLVQFIQDDEWHTAYFAEPPHGTPPLVHPSKLDALRNAVGKAQHNSAREG